MPAEVGFKADTSKPSGTRETGLSKGLIIRLSFYPNEAIRFSLGGQAGQGRAG